MDTFQFLWDIAMNEAKTSPANFNKEMLVKISNSNNVDFECSENRLCYLYKYCLLNTHFFEQGVAEFLNNFAFEKLNVNSNLTLCSLSVGPGTEFLAFFSALLKHTEQKVEFRQVLMINKYESWKNVFKHISAKIKNLYPAYFSSTTNNSANEFAMLQEDIFAENSEPVKKYLKTADFILSFRVFVVNHDPNKILFAFTRVVDLLKPGAVLFLADNESNLDILSSNPYGRFLYGPLKIKCDICTQCNFTDSLKNSFGKLPITTGRGHFAVWQKSLTSTTSDLSATSSLMTTSVGISSEVESSLQLPFSLSEDFNSLETKIIDIFADNCAKTIIESAQLTVFPHFRQVLNDCIKSDVISGDILISDIDREIGSSLRSCDILNADYKDLEESKLSNTDINSLNGDIHQSKNINGSKMLQTNVSLKNTDSFNDKQTSEQNSSSTDITAKVKKKKKKDVTIIIKGEKNLLNHLENDSEICSDLRSCDTFNADFKDLEVSKLSNTDINSVGLNDDIHQSENISGCKMLQANESLNNTNFFNDKQTSELNSNSTDITAKVKKTKKKKKKKKKDVTIIINGEKSSLNHLENVSESSNIKSNIEQKNHISIQMKIPEHTVLPLEIYPETESNRQKPNVLKIAPQKMGNGTKANMLHQRCVSSEIKPTSVKFPENIVTDTKSSYTQTTISQEQFVFSSTSKPGSENNAQKKDLLKSLASNCKKLNDAFTELLSNINGDSKKHCYTYSHCQHTHECSSHRCCLKRSIPISSESCSCSRHFGQTCCNQLSSAHNPKSSPYCPQCLPSGFTQNCQQHNNSVQSEAKPHIMLPLQNLSNDSMLQIISIIQNSIQ